MNNKATVTAELYGPADSEGRKLIYLRVSWKAKFSRYSSGTKIRLTPDQFANRRLKTTATAFEDVDKALAAAKNVIDNLGQDFTFATFKQQYRETFFGRQAGDTITISDAKELYFASRNISTKTKSSYTIAVNWMKRYTGDVRLAEISSDTLKGYIVFMKKEHTKADFLRRKKRGENPTAGHEMSENSVRINLRAIRAIYNYGVKKAGLQLNNPFRDLDGQSTGSIPRQKGALTVEELQGLISYSPKDKDEELARDFFLLTIQMSGANIGDLLSLKNGDLHGDEAWFTRRKTHHGGIITKVPFTSWSRETYSKYGNIDPSAPDREILPILWGAKTEKLILSRIHDFDIRINAGLRSIAAALEMEPFTTMIARHTFAVLSVSNGFTIEQLQHFMGHASPNTTKIYVKSIDTGVIRKSAEMLESLMTPRQKED